LSPSERFVIALNGEIYNHFALREELEHLEPDVQNRWRGHSDTETLLAAFEVFGIERTIQKSVGMFAFALWDRRAQTLFLVRDRMGEKPLYYGYVGNVFAFCSELKSLAVLPGFEPHVDRAALALFLRHNCVPSPHSIYVGVSKLAPGSWLEVTLDTVQRRGAPTIRSYWSAMEHVRECVREPHRFSSDLEATASLEAALKEAIAGQMVADVPLGAFLSGGIDSSTVVSLMQAQSRTPVKTFSIGFDVAGYNEAPNAKAVAQHLGTEHTELYVSSADALAVIPKLPTIYDEPFADSSQVPTYLVAQLARKHVTVSLSGDGGDELFGGYNRYFLGARIWRYLQHVPRALRALAARTILAQSPAFWDACYSLFTPLIPPSRRLATAGSFLHKGARLLDSENGMVLYRGLVSHWHPPEVVSEREPESAFLQFDRGLPGLTETMMALDAVTYLPDDILVKVDRAAMAVSLETRVPMLDHRVFEFAWRLPMHYKVRNGVGKWLLRQVLYRHVPKELLERPKMGFGIPIDGWLRGPLRAWAEELLDESRLKREGYFDPAAIRRKWAEHLSGRANWQYHLWDVLMFQAWLEEHVSRRQPTIH
jgi:asparagine synthase (glutamine-hydrolysing)